MESQGQGGDPQTAVLQRVDTILLRLLIGADIDVIRAVLVHREILTSLPLVHLQFDRRDGKGRHKGAHSHDSISWELHLRRHDPSQPEKPSDRSEDRPGIHNADLTAHRGTNSLIECVGVQ